MSRTSRDARTRRFRAIGVAVLALVVLPGLVWAALWIRSVGRWDQALHRATEMVCATADVRIDGSATASVRLTADDGTSVCGRLREGAASVDSSRTAFLLLGGVRTGVRAASLFEPPPGSIVLACDYPLLERLPPDDVVAKVRSVPGLVDGAAESLPAFATALRWLAHRPGVRHVIVVGVSLGTPYAAALSRDPCVDGVALLYGGGDVTRIIERALPVDPPAARRTLAFLLGKLIAPLDPVRHIGCRPDLPVLLVNADDDQRIPPESVRALQAAAPATARHVTVPGRHVRPEADLLVARAVEEVVRWSTELVAPDS